MLNIKYIGIFLGLMVFLNPLSASACNIAPYAKSYVNSINEVLGGEKPKVVVLNGKSKNTLAYYSKKTIYIYKGDYGKSCSEETPFLKSVIAHEYAHHIEKSLEKIAKLKGEKLARVSEHSIADEILGEAEYDNKADVKYPKQYQAIVEMIRKKQIARIIGSNSNIKIVF